MTGPSASGSENGMPTSSTSAPARSSAHRISAERDRSGSPAVTYVTSPVRFSARMRSNAAAILDGTVGSFRADQLRHAMNIFVAPSRQIDQNLCVGAQLLCQLARVGDG